MIKYGTYLLCILFSMTIHANESTVIKPKFKSNARLNIGTMTVSEKLPKLDVFKSTKRSGEILEDENHVMYIWNKIYPSAMGCLSNVGHSETFSELRKIQTKLTRSLENKKREEYNNLLKDSKDSIKVYRIYSNNDRNSHNKPNRSISGTIYVDMNNEILAIELTKEYESIPINEVMLKKITKMLGEPSFIHGQYSKKQTLIYGDYPDIRSRDTHSVFASIENPLNNDSFDTETKGIATVISIERDMLQISYFSIDLGKTIDAYMVKKGECIDYHEKMYMELLNIERNVDDIDL